MTVPQSHGGEAVPMSIVLIQIVFTPRDLDSQTPSAIQSIQPHSHKSSGKIGPCINQGILGSE